MSNRSFFTKNRAINKNAQIKKLRNFGDKLAEKITEISGSIAFLLFNVFVFVAWILINTGQFGERFVFDEYPFGLLTTAVSLEAIILAVFVLITQNRQSKHSEIRSELDYITDLQADAEINIIINMLERIAGKQNIEIDDLLSQLSESQRKILSEHPLTKNDLED